MLTPLFANARKSFFDQYHSLMRSIFGVHACADFSGALPHRVITQYLFDSTGQFWGGEFVAMDHPGCDADIMQQLPLYAKKFRLKH